MLEKLVLLAHENIAIESSCFQHCLNEGHFTMTISISRPFPRPQAKKAFAELDTLKEGSVSLTDFKINELAKKVSNSIK